MPVEVKGIAEMRKALRQLEPDLNKNLNKEVRALLKPIVTEARGYIENDPKGLSNWVSKGGTKQITKSTSMFRKGTFPAFNSALVRAGITYSVKPTKRNFSGFVAAFQLINKTAAGSIYETAGTVHKDGQPWAGKNGKLGKRYSHSNNEFAGKHFIESLGGQSNIKGYKRKRGRLIYRAWEENNGRSLNLILKAIRQTETEFNKRQGTVTREAA